MDKKEMQHWIDYLNNGGNALDMLDELERKAEEKRRESLAQALTQERHCTILPLKAKKKCKKIQTKTVMFL